MYYSERYMIIVISVTLSASETENDVCRSNFTNLAASVAASMTHAALKCINGQTESDRMLQVNRSRLLMWTETEQSTTSVLAGTCDVKLNLELYDVDNNHKFGSLISIRSSHHYRLSASRRSLLNWGFHGIYAIIGGWRIS